MDDFPAVMKFMPVEKEFKKLPKQWIVNVCFSVICEEFSDWVTKTTDENHEKHRKEHNMDIALAPKVYEAFIASTQVSSK